MLIIWSLNPIGIDLQSMAKHQFRTVLSLLIKKVPVLMNGASALQHLTLTPRMS